uniref:Putative glycosyl transferase family 2 (Rhamnosyl transferase) n=1 Tax=mine drainage metagenome TaxID=410659 RepID=E6PN33_9ZZZZ
MKSDQDYDISLPRIDCAVTVLEQPLVIIIILNWNGWQDTLNCLSTLKEVDYKNFNLIIIDNGSIDDSINRLRAEDPNLKIIETGGNRGFAGGCNVGIWHAFEMGAKYIWLLNNDTKVDQKSLSALVAAAEDNQEIGAVGSVLYEMDHPNLIQAWGGGVVDLHTGKSHHVKKQNDAFNYLTGGSLLLKVKALQQCGLLDEGFFVYWEDTDLSFRLVASGWKLAVEPTSKVWHKESASTGRFSKSRARLFYKSRVRFFYRHSPWPLFAILYGLLDQTMRDIYRRRGPHLIGVWEGTLLGFADKRRSWHSR